MGLFSSSVRLAEGDAAPDFTLPDQAGREVSLAGLRGKRVVLFFYPKADTPGCTKEVCSFRDEAPEYPKDVVVLGISKDTVAAQDAFAKKQRLAFPLLADASGDVIARYGVDMPLLGIAKRKTFLVDSKGKIAKVYGDVSPAGHAKEVLEDLAAVK